MCISFCRFVGSGALGRACGVAVAVVCALSPAAQLHGQNVQINEVMFHPPGTNVLEQWFELLNAGTNAVDLSGWSVTKGVDFTFPAPTVLAPGGFLVVAADAGTFAGDHPGVTNVVAGWHGTLGHSLEISDSAGRVVDRVEFYSQGDWATRVLGAGGMAGALDDYGGLGWVWSAPQDGHGASLELINPALPNNYAHNWAPNRDTSSTPGRANSVAAVDAAPFIIDVTHAPVIPQPSDPVRVTARIMDEQPAGVTVTLRWRVDGAAGFNAVPMADDGAHGDGLANDGIYGAIVPAQPDLTIVEFYLEARDAANHLRVYPNWIAPAGSSRTANLLYQVDASSYAGDQPVYRLVMTEEERNYLENLSDDRSTTDSDAQMNATWVTKDGVVTGGTTTQLRYNIGVRNRGHGSRSNRPHNFHVNIPEDRLWKKQAGINLNENYAFDQVLASAIFRRLAVPMPDSRAVQVRVNGVNQMELSLPNANSFGSYAGNEQYNNDFVKRSWPLDPNGNSYRGIRDAAAGINGVADLTWHGADWAVSAYTNAYYKQNNLIENDWSDLIRLLGVLNEIPGYSTPSTYEADVRQIVNVDEWMKDMAVNTLLDNGETSLANGVGDDYALFRGVKDPRFLALPYDLDTIMGRGRSTSSPRDGLWRMTSLDALDRFMKDPAFAPVYFRWLKTLAETAFSPARMDPFIDQVLGSFVPQDTRDNFKAFNASHVRYVLSQIPSALTVAATLGQNNGYAYTTSSSLSLDGTADAVQTRRILVNGAEADYVAWQGAWSIGGVALRPGINRVVVQALGTNDVEVGRLAYDVWYDDGGVTTISGGSMTSDATWTSANGPYEITSSLTIPSGVTLTIQPGTTVYLGSGAHLTVDNGGQLLAEGASNAWVRFTRVPGGGSWDGITVNGAAGSPETRIAYAYFEFNGTTAIHSSGGTVFLDHLDFGTTSHQYVSLDNSSFVVSHSHFPTATAGFELLHGTSGIKSGGRGVIYRNFFGAVNGYNDVIDFTGGNRPAQAIVQIIDNVFTGSGDDLLDLDGTDAWVEGNIFLHCHKNGAPDSSSAVSGGDDSGQTSEITIVGNIVYDCDDAAMAKQGNFYTLLNNTIVRQTRVGGTDTDGAVVCMSDAGTPEGAGMYLEGNIIYDAEKLVRNQTASIVTYTNNILPLPWNGPGGGNAVADPRFKHVPQLSETTNFTTWESAQVMRDWLSLQPGSPARGTGPNGRDQGALVPFGASVSGEPVGTNNATSATLRVGFNRTGHGIPTAGFPQGSGYVAYRYRLDNGPWSAEQPIQTPLALSGLSAGPHQVEVSGKRDAGLYQDDPVYGEDAVVSASRTWVVDPAYVPPALPTVRLNEVLAMNQSTLTNGAATPDLIELFNTSARAVALAGLGLTDNADLPFKFVFPANSMLPAHGYLVIYADNDFAAPGLHTGFSLKASGDDLYLHDAAANGGALVDSVSFGPQVADLSIGRMPDGTWTLCRPTFGAENSTGPLGDEWSIKINEWLADAQFAAKNDFVELFNPDPQPVALGGLFLSDSAGSPDRHQIAPLSYIAGGGFASFVADGQTGQGADHLDFKLSPDVGIILLSGADLTPIDSVSYGPQQTDVSEGRSPSGGDTLTRFAQPTSGGPNPGPVGGGAVTNITETVLTLLDVPVSTWRWEDSGTDLGTAWRDPAFNDSAWSSGIGLFGRETTPQEYPYPFQSSIPSPSQGGPITVYYRTHFQWNGGLSQFELVATNYIDDGAVFYLNGVEVGRLRVSAGQDASTRAGDQGNEGQPEILKFSAGNLTTGDNVMAVEVHQQSGSSSDDVFGMSLSAIQSTTNIINQGLGVPVMLNEVLARNHSLTNDQGRAVDFVELYNPTTNTVDLSDLSLSNDPNAPRRWIFPTNSALGASSYLVIYFDNNTPVSSTNTGFALSATGDAVYFFNRPASGGELLDAVHFGLQAPDFAVGRVPDGGGNWALVNPTPAAANEAAGLAGYSSLRINEWMADPASGSDWLEVCNLGRQPAPLGGLFLTDDLADPTRSPIAPLSFIGGGGNGFAQFIADGNAGAGADHVNFSLNKDGEAIGLFSPAGVMIDGVTFGAQATGTSEGRLPDGADHIVSFAMTASPAEPNFLPLPDAVINEVLTHTDPPLEDAVELLNTSGSPVDVGGWFLSNATDDLKKYRLADGTILPANGFLVIYENQFNTGPAAFTFNSAHGDQAILSQADALGNLTGYRAQVQFGPAENGVSFGRYTTSVGVDFTALSARTFGKDNPATVEEFRTGTGLPNAGAKVGPVVISEIMFHPVDSAGSVPAENAEDEFLELRNISGSAVPLFDPANPTNTWRLRRAVDFDLPAGITLDPGGQVLVVGFPPSDAASLAAFRAKYNVPPSVPVLGPWNGRLDDAGESIELLKPDTPQGPPHPDAGFVPYILVERVDYSPAPPWPNADGNGSSLQRGMPAAYGNDPASWSAAPPTAGQSGNSGFVDADHDGMDDNWELSHFQTLSRDGTGDLDQDGLTDLQEYLAGTDPTSPGSVLKVLPPAAGDRTLTIAVAAGHSYTIQFRDELAGGGWRKLMDLPVQSSSGMVSVTDTTSPAPNHRFYRAVTPAQP